MKQTASVKAAQKGQQTALMELEQVDEEVESAAAERAEAEESIAKSRAELADMQSNLEKLQVRWLVSTISGSQSRLTLLSSYPQQAKFFTSSAELKKEQAALASFDNELADLERDIKHKKQEMADAELAIKSAEHDLQQHLVDQKKWNKKVEDLEHQFTWIKEEKRSVLCGQFPRSIFR